LKAAIILDLETEVALQVAAILTEQKCRQRTNVRETVAKI